MNHPILLVLLFVTVPVMWLAAEFRAGRAARVMLGMLMILSSGIAAAGLASMLFRLNYNSYYGGASSLLIATTIEQIEDGQLNRVLKVLRGLDLNFQPTWKDRARYDDLVTKAAQLMRGDTSITPGSSWDASDFDRRTWEGHWENDTGFWLVIGGARNVVRSGDPPEALETVSLSDDSRTLICKSQSGMRYTLTLINKYEAQLEWYDMNRKSVWRVERVHKLIRPTPEMRLVTQQSGESAPE